MENVSVPHPPISKSNLTMKKSSANSQLLRESIGKSIRPSTSQDQVLPNDADGYIMKGTYNILNNVHRRSSRSSLGWPASKSADNESLKDFYKFGDPIMMSNGKLGYLNHHQNSQQENQSHYSSFHQGNQPTDNIHYYPDYYMCPYPQPLYYTYPYLATNNHAYLHVNVDPFASPCYYSFDYIDENNFCQQVPAASYQQFETYPNTSEQYTSLKYEDCSTPSSTTHSISTQTGSSSDVENSEESPESNDEPV
ncbi:hypothetical protein LSTR_LSTR007396 [Laodelphax striatellus]|uniref:Uncharacterized protein n=1 Tax=Laodelphax striatellus TaxID=195883 RepID=A0A482XPW3_LAOST|nr:hypothetical protein LSTR_LSTR007396 [Laodelphax striatellus]